MVDTHIGLNGVCVIKHVELVIKHEWEIVLIQHLWMVESHVMETA